MTLSTLCALLGVTSYVLCCLTAFWMSCAMSPHKGISRCWFVASVGFLLAGISGAVSLVAKVMT